MSRADLTPACKFATVSAETFTTQVLQIYPSDIQNLMDRDRSSGNLRPMQLCLL